MAKYWYQKNLRFLQTVLRETDIIDYDPADVVQYMKDTNSNVLVVNSGGVIDFFKHDLDMANLNRFYQHEILPSLCDEIHKAGMKVITRVDFRGVEPRRYNLHPDWFSVDQNGKPMLGHGGTNKGQTIFRPCYNSPYIKVHAPRFIDFLLDKYDLDGIWQNALGFDYGPCYCKNCRELYLKDTGKEIPPLPNGPYDYAALGTPQFAEYNAWKVAQADKHIEMMRAGVKKHGAEKAYCAEIFDIYSQGFTVTTGISQTNAKKSFDFIISAVFLGKHYLWDNRLWDTINNSATTIRFARALEPKKQPVICTGGNGTTWRYVKDPLVDNRQWMWEIAGVGGGIWNCYFNGRHPGRTSDRRAAYSEKDVYTYLADNSDIISDTVPYAEIGVYYSNASRDHLLNGDESKDQYGVCFRGIERALLENHIQYQFIPDTEISSERLKLYKTVLLPNTAYLSDKEIAFFKEYVKNGGSIIASFKTSLFDEKGNARNDFGMADLFGLHYTGLCVDTSVDTYQLIRKKDHPLMKDIGDTDVIINGGQSLIVTKENKDYDTVATYIPTIHNQPPEYAWIPDMKTDYPTIIAGKYGAGKVVYFANPIEALIHTNGHDDYRDVYKNALDYASGGNYLVKTGAPGSVHINVIQDQNDPNHLILSMVNATGTYQRPWKKLVSVPVELTLAVDGKSLRFSKALWGDGIKAESKKDAAFISIPLLYEFASIELRF
jgi:hypothetical protein